MQWVTAGQATQRQPRPVADAMLDDGDPRVLRARRRKPAGRRKQRRDDSLIPIDQAHRNTGQPFHSATLEIARSAPRTSVESRSNAAEPAGGRPTITMSTPAGAASRLRRYASRSLRRTRL